MFVQFGLEIAGSEIDRQAAFLVATVFSTMPMRSASFMISSSPSIFTRCRTIAEQDRITGLKVERNQLAAAAREDADQPRAETPSRSPGAG